MIVQHKRITQTDDFKQVAKDIVDNIELWRVDSQAKTEQAFKKIMGNMREKEAQRAKLVAEGAIHVENDYGYGRGRNTGD